MSVKVSSNYISVPNEVPDESWITALSGDSLKISSIEFDLTDIKMKWAISAVRQYSDTYVHLDAEVIIEGERTRFRRSEYIGYKDREKEIIHEKIITIWVTFLHKLGKVINQKIPYNLFLSRSG
jgi:hypothetical protein